MEVPRWHDDKRMGSCLCPKSHMSSSHESCVIFEYMNGNCFAPYIYPCRCVGVPRTLHREAELRAGPLSRRCNQTQNKIGACLHLGWQDVRITHHCCHLDTRSIWARPPSRERTCCGLCHNLSSVPCHARSSVSCHTWSFVLLPFSSMSLYSFLAWGTLDARVVRCRTCRRTALMVASHENNTVRPCKAQELSIPLFELVLSTPMVGCCSANSADTDQGVLVPASCIATFFYRDWINSTAPTGMILIAIQRLSGTHYWKAVQIICSEACIFLQSTLLVKLCALMQLLQVVVKYLLDAGAPPNDMVSRTLSMQLT